MNPLDSAVEEQEGNFTVVEEGTCILEDEIKVEPPQEEEVEEDPLCKVEPNDEAEEQINENVFIHEELFDNDLMTKTFEDEEVFVNEVTIEDSKDEAA